MSGTSDKIKGVANEAVGNLKQGVGKVTGNEELQVKGAVQEKKGEAQQVEGEVKNTVKDAVKKP
ncbi:MAG: CsbD family protein [Oxalobacteraceae bacterium]|nr:MAG: CsbD family protein [Oxalobacteraceae bacterium]